jgi:hypothetical protein
LARFFDELTHVNTRELNRWLGLLQEAIAQGRFEAEYQRLLGEGLSYVERAVMAWLDTSNSTQAQQLIYRLAQSGWRAPELAPQQYPSEYLEQLRQLMERMFWTTSLVEFLVQIAQDLGLTPGPVRGFFALVNTFNNILSLLGAGRCASTGECIARFMEEAYRATLRMAVELNFSNTEVNEFARSLLDIMRTFSQRGNFEYQWGNVLGLLVWMNQGGHARYDQGFGIIVSTARIVSNMPSSLTGWSASLVGIVPRNNGTWWGAVMIFTHPTIAVDPRQGLRYVGVIGGDHCQSCSAKVNDIVRWIYQALSEVQRQMTSYGIDRDRGLVAFAFTKPGADIGAVLDALIATLATLIHPLSSRGRPETVGLCICVSGKPQHALR